MSILSVVLPAYNEEQMVGKTCRVLHEVLSGAGMMDQKITHGMKY